MESAYNKRMLIQNASVSSPNIVEDEPEGIKKAPRGKRNSNSSKDDGGSNAVARDALALSTEEGNESACDSSQKEEGCPR